MWWLEQPLKSRNEWKIPLNFCGNPFPICFLRTIFFLPLWYSTGRTFREVLKFLSVEYAIIWTSMYFFVLQAQGRHDFFASYVDLGNVLFSSNMSIRRLNKPQKLVSDHSYFPFKLYNITNAPNLVYFSEVGYKGFSASSSKDLKALGSSSKCCKYHESCLQRHPD